MSTRPPLDVRGMERVVKLVDLDSTLLIRHPVRFSARNETFHPNGSSRNRRRLILPKWRSTTGNHGTEIVVEIGYDPLHRPD